MIRGYVGSGNSFHGRRTCPALTGHIVSAPEEWALKHDKEYCPVCLPNLAKDVTEA